MNGVNGAEVGKLGGGDTKGFGDGSRIFKLMSGMRRKWKCLLGWYALLIKLGGIVDTWAFS